MNFLKNYRMKKQFNNDLINAKMRDEPIYEGIISVVYSIHKDELNFLVLERSKNTYPWPGMKMFGVMGESENRDEIIDVKRLIKESIAPNVNDNTFEKIIKNINHYNKLNFNMKEEFLNISANVYLTEIDDYVLRSCRGFKNENVNNCYYVKLEDLFKQIQNTKIHYSEISETIQPHFAHTFWLESVHKEIMTKYLGKLYILELFI